MFGVSCYYNFDVALTFACSSHDSTKLSKFTSYECRISGFIEKVYSIEEFQFCIAEAIDANIYAHNLWIISAIGAIVMIDLALAC